MHSPSIPIRGRIPFNTYNGNPLRNPYNGCAETLVSEDSSQPGGFNTSESILLSHKLRGTGMLLIMSGWGFLRVSSIVWEIREVVFLATSVR